MTIAVHEIQDTAPKYNALKPEGKAEIYKALISAQSEFQPIFKSKKVNFGNVSYKYADFDDLVQSVRPILNKNNLLMMQHVNSQPDSTTFIETQIAHQSGQIISSRCKIDLPKDPKQAGAIITYYKRYCLESFLGVSTNEDTDANVGRETNPPKPDKKPVQPKNAATGAKSSTITEAQKKRLWAIAGEKGLGKDQMVPLLKGFGFESSKDVSKALYDKVIAAVEAFDGSN